MLLVLAGVPPDLVATSPKVYANLQARAAFYQAVLSDPRMQFRATPASGPGAPALAPSCTAGTAPAYPPRRLIEYMRASNPSEVRIASLCDDDMATGLYDALKIESG